METNEPSILKVIDAQFKALGRGKKALFLDGRTTHANLPQREISVVELRSVLLHPSTNNDARNAVLGEVVTRARQSQPWQIVLVALLLPGLRMVRSRFVRKDDPLFADINAALVAGVLEGLASDLGTERIAPKLVAVAHRRAKEVIRQEVRQHRLHARAEDTGIDVLASPHAAFDRLVAKGVITETEADLVAATRLDGHCVSDIAAAHGMSGDTLRHRRRRIEARIAASLKEEI